MCPLIVSSDATLPNHCTKKQPVRLGAGSGLDCLGGQARDIQNQVFWELVSPLSGSYDDGVLGEPVQALVQVLQGMDAGRQDVDPQTRAGQRAPGD